MVVAQYIRLHPMNCSNQCALRLELYACNITAGKKRNVTCMTLYLQCTTTCRCLLCIAIEQNKTGRYKSWTRSTRIAFLGLKEKWLFKPKLFDVCADFTKVTCSLEIRAKVISRGLIIFLR